METRMERTRRRKKEKKNRFFKKLIICMIFVIFCSGIKVTEKSVQELTGENKGRVFFLDLTKEEINIEFFGKKYKFYVKDLLNKVDNKVIK